MIGWQQPLQIDGAPFQLRAIRPLHARLPTVWFRRLVRGRQWEERVVHARSVAGGATPPLRISSQPLRLGASERRVWGALRGPGGTPSNFEERHAYGGALPSVGGLGGPFEAPHVLIFQNHSKLRRSASCRCTGSVRRWSPPAMMTRSQGSAARAYRIVPCSTGTTSSASPWIVRWCVTPAGDVSYLWEASSSRNGVPMDSPPSTPSPRSSRLAGAFHVTTGSASRRSAATCRATKPPMLDPSSPKRRSSRG